MNISEIIIYKLILEEKIPITWNHDEHMTRIDMGVEKIVEGFVPKEGEISIHLRNNTTTHKEFLLMHETVHAIIRLKDIKLDNTIEESVANFISAFLYEFNDNNADNPICENLFCYLISGYSWSPEFDITIDLIEEESVRILKFIINRWFKYSDDDIFNLTQYFREFYHETKKNSNELQNTLIERRNRI